MKEALFEIQEWLEEAEENLSNISMQIKDNQVLGDSIAIDTNLEYARGQVDTLTSVIDLMSTNV